jgi:hypothetical protein
MLCWGHLGDPEIVVVVRYSTETEPGLASTWRRRRTIFVSGEEQDGGRLPQRRMAQQKTAGH